MAEFLYQDSSYHDCCLLHAVLPYAGAELQHSI